MTDTTTTTTATADTGGDHVDVLASQQTGNPFRWSNAKKAYGAAITADVAAAGGLSATQFIANGGIDLHAVGLEGLALAGLFVVTFIGAWLPTNKS